MITTLNVNSIKGDNLPSLGSLFGAEDPERKDHVPRSLDDCWKTELATRLIPNLFDRLTPPEKKRHFEIKLSFSPDATLQSCRVEAQLKTVLVSTKAPGPMRLVFAQRAGEVQVSQRPTPPEISEEGGEVYADPEGMPSIDGLNDGKINTAFQFELLRVILNLGDPRTDQKRARTITLRIALSTDIDRETMTYELMSIRSRLAAAKRPDPHSYFMAFDGADGSVSIYEEPVGFLNTGDGPKLATQSRIN